MMLDELMRAVDELSEEELRHVNNLSADERIQMLEEAADAIREGLTPEELDEMIAAMNEEYIEPWDEAEWKF